VATAVPGAAAPQAASKPIIATAPAPVVAERRKDRRLARGDCETSNGDIKLPFN
jgi:hypothetical protein